MKEAGRRCQRCHFGWYAKPASANPGKPRWFDETGSVWTDGQARMARRTANYDRHLKDKDQWEQCPNCGSRSVKTDKSRDFQPSGAIAPFEAPRSAEVGGPAGQPSSEPARAPSSWRPLWQTIGKFHSTHWRIIWAVVFGVAPFGSIGDDTTYTGTATANFLEFVGILIGCWAVASMFLFLNLRHGRDS